MEYIMVTGAGGGMGRKTVEELKNLGFSVIALDKTAVEPSENVIPIEADITDPEGVNKAFKAINEVTDRLYAIVHLAGVYKLDSLVEIENGDFENAFKVNLFGAFYINKSFRPLLKGGSKIIIMTSELAALDPLPFTGIYAVTKSALDKYAYSLRMELQLSDICVSVIRAGAVDTGMLGASTAALQKFCENTRLYSCNAERFKNIVDRVEARCVPPERIARKIGSMLKKGRPKFAYSINRNPLLLLLNALPKGLQLWIIKQVLK